MSTKAYAWLAAAILVLPAPAQAQQDPQLIGEGARVYSSNCARCHNARSSMERTDAEWAVIVLHMRARANFTKAEAAAVLAYLQATNMPEGGGTANDGDRNLVVLPASLVEALRDHARSVAADSRTTGRDAIGR